MVRVTCATLAYLFYNDELTNFDPSQFEEEDIDDEP